MVFTLFRRAPNGEIEILSANGELDVTLNTGVKYVLRFGNISGVEDSNADSEAGVNRYLLVTTKVDETQFPAARAANRSKDSGRDEGKDGSSNSSTASIRRRGTSRTILRGVRPDSDPSQRKGKRRLRRNRQHPQPAGEAPNASPGTPRYTPKPNRRGRHPKVMIAPEAEAPEAEAPAAVDSKPKPSDEIN